MAKWLKSLLSVLIYIIVTTHVIGLSSHLTPRYFDDDQLEDDFGGTLPSRWGWTEFVESEQAMSQPKKAWYACGAGVKVNEAWNSNGLVAVSAFGYMCGC